MATPGLLKGLSGSTLTHDIYSAVHLLKSVGIVFLRGGEIEPNKYCFERCNKVDLDFLPWVEILASLIEKQLIQGTYF